jgi:hypothetical protein
MTHTETSDSGEWMTAMAAATRYGISIETLRHWVNWQGYPQDSRRREGRYMMYEVNKIDAWLRTRRISKLGTRPNWLTVVNHPAAVA